MCGCVRACVCTCVHVHAHKQVTTCIIVILFRAICVKQSRKLPTFPTINTMCKPQIRTILGLSSANLGFDSCAAILGLSQYQSIRFEQSIIGANNYKHVPRLSDTASLIYYTRKLATQARARERSRACARAKERGKGQA